MRSRRRGPHQGGPARFAVFLALLTLTTFGRAADHRDSPLVAADPAADIADIFAWTASASDAINLVMTIPVPEFSDAVQYAFRVESSAAYGESGDEIDVICTFDAEQNVECWVGDDDYVAGDASDEAGLTSDSGRVRVFVGHRDDPFFFNSSGLRDTLDIVAAALPQLQLDGAGCPLLDASTSDALVQTLQSNGNAVDNFAGRTVGALVLQIDRELLTSGGNIVAVWGSTHRS